LARTIMTPKDTARMTSRFNAGSQKGAPMEAVVMSVEELREYISNLPDDEIVRITFWEADDGTDGKEAEAI